VLAAIEKETQKQNITIAKSGGYAVQVGAFSDYKRAKNYATDVKNDVAKKYAAYQVEVEEANNAGGKMYRSVYLITYFLPLRM
jgi:cell division septation protein DedD